eukprot:TRINITY_DN6340_c0_g2_i2.p2 TRINITY_DN6340_c0_g2~~TRINITY_DN6340_c0_g2_i2.p2  ORF type:complete len:111 (-),score=34.71 TRINITY_DN6340_c0_g2_i2:41-373(-)
MGDEEQIHFKVTWKHIDMTPDEEYEGEHTDMVKHALKTAVKSFNNTENNAEKDIAQQIKKEFDKEYKPCWHCIVGTSFGSQFHYEPHKYCLLYTSPSPRDRTRSRMPSSA